MVTIRMDTLVVTVAIGVVLVAMMLMASSLVIQSLLRVNVARLLEALSTARRKDASSGNQLHAERRRAAGPASPRLTLHHDDVADGRRHTPLRRQLS